MTHDELIAQATLHTELYRKGMEQGQHFERQKFEAVIIAYDRALQDQSMRIPTYLQLAIEHARSELQKQNIAAEVGIRKDQRERHEGRPEQDLDIFGRQLRMGS